MNMLKKIFVEILDSVKELLLTVGIIAAIAIAIGGYVFFAITRVDPDTVTVKYIADATTANAAAAKTIFDIGFTEIASSQDAEVIEKWLNLMEESTAGKTVTAFRAYSAAFPCYLVEFRDNSVVKKYYVVTTKEVAFSQVRSQKYVGYAHLNPFYDQAAELMETMSTKSN